jgi:hypothetical protein
VEKNESIKWGGHKKKVNEGKYSESIVIIYEN